MAPGALTRTKPTDGHPWVSDAAAVREIQLHVELHRPVIAHIRSKDVIHSFFLPVMRVKQDAIPGMDVPVHFTPILSSQGQTWQIACARW